MRWTKTLQIIDVHCEGEIGKVVTAGVLDLPGESIAKKLAYINQVDDGLRRLLTLEPRSACAGSVNLLLPVTSADADVAFIILQADKAHAMSGSNAICVATALLETGAVAMREPQTIVKLETAAGIVSAIASCRQGACESVSLEMTPAFVEALDIPLATHEWGEVRLDLCFGGVFYALIDVDQLGMRIEPACAAELANAGVRIKAMIGEHMSVRHPDIPEINDVAYVMFRDRDPDGAVRTCTTMWPGRVDRSPCGTGSSAHLATMHARGLIEPGGEFISRSIIGSEFHVALRGLTEVAGRPAVLPEITGRAWVYGFHQIGIDPTDPFPRGFALSDTWGDMAGEI